MTPERREQDAEKDERADRTGRTRRVVEDHPEAGDSEDHLTLTEEAAYGEVHPDATAEAYEAQTNRGGRMPEADRKARERAAEDEDVRGSALPSEEGHRS